MPSRHLIISGTGRAGTSFLVQYLHACGLDTHLGRHEDAQLDEQARAGLEDYPVPGEMDDLPYVIKSPWISYDPASALSPDLLIADAVIIPVRPLRDAASSRIANETAEMFKTAPWMRKLPKTFTYWGPTPGGMVYPLHVEDQQRMLAVGFHHLVQHCLRHDIRFVLLDFPRLVEDAEYLYSALSDVIDVDRETALSAHAALADPSLVRAGKTPSADAESEAETTALKNELRQAKHALEGAEDALDGLKSEIAQERQHLLDALSGSANDPAGLPAMIEVVANHVQASSPETAEALRQTAHHARKNPLRRLKAQLFGKAPGHGK